MTDPRADDATPKHWTDDVSPPALAVAHAGFERAQIAGDRAAWQAAVARLVPGHLVTTSEAARQAEAAAHAWRYEATSLQEKLDRREADHRQDVAAMRATIAATWQLVDRRRKTVRMSDLTAVLEGEVT